MLKLVTKYGLAAHLAFVAVAPLFLSPVPILWLSALGFVWFLMEPSRIGKEMLHDARRRVGRAVRRDPLFWVLLVLVVLSAVRAFNTGIGMAYDAEAMKWTLSSPILPILPGSVEGKGFVYFSVAVLSLVVITAARHALGKKARVAFVMCASFIVSVELLVRLFWGNAAPELFSKEVSCLMTDPAYKGAAYGILLLLALPNLVSVFENRWWKVFPVAMIGVCGTSVGLCLYAPPSSIALHSAAAVVILTYGFVFLKLKVSKTADFKYLVICGLSLVGAAMVVMTVLPPDVLSAKTDPFLTGDFWSDSFLKTRQTLSAVSLRIWTQSPWLGSGLGSFAQALAFNADPSDWSTISALQTAPLNGYWLLLVERGVLGAFALAVPLTLLILTWVHHLITAKKVLPSPQCLLAPLTAIIAILETLLDGSFLLPETIVPFAIAFTISASSFSKEMNRDGK